MIFRLVIYPRERPPRVSVHILYDILLDSRAWTIKVLGSTPTKKDLKGFKTQYTNITWGRSVLMKKRKPLAMRSLSRKIINTQLKANNWFPTVMYLKRGKY